MNLYCKQFYLVCTLIIFIYQSVPATSKNIDPENSGFRRPERPSRPTPLLNKLLNNKSELPNPTHPPLPSPAQSTNKSTFQICNKTPERIEPERFYRNKTEHLVTYLKEYRKNNCVRVIQGTNFGGAVEPGHNNGFLNTVIQAYNGHHNLVIRPDDIWTAIIAQFSLYINSEANVERFRKRFVNFEGKKDLVVDLGVGSLDTVSYSTFVDLMTKEIHKNIVDPEIRDWILPNFTTTTSDDKITAGVIFMATLKKYFNYIGTIACGIPKITLEGSLDDWKNIAERLKKLKTYKLNEWVDDMLEPILQQFIRAKSGDVDAEFWNDMVTVQSVGCGSTDVAGWITAFSVFNEEGKWRVYKVPGQKWPQFDIDSIISGIVQVDVLIDDNGVKHETVMFAGHIGKEILSDGYTLRPKIGWAIALKAPADKTSSVSEWDY